MTTTELQGWALALRDLCDQGAQAASVTFPGATLAYSSGQATLITPEGRSDFSDADLDEVGLVPTDGELVLMTASVTEQP
jgi:hypothetical protein